MTVIHSYLFLVRLSLDQLKDCIMKHPSLLQYSTESLRAKVAFLTNEIGIQEESISRVITIAPVVLGLSLEENLRPTVSTLQSQCNLSPNQVGHIITTCPSILTLSLKRKIEPCLSFLTTTLYISTTYELGQLILTTPRILLQGIETSLDRKVTMMIDAIHQERSSGKAFASEKAATIFKANPALLATTNTILQKRINDYVTKSDKSIEEIFTRRTSGRKKLFDTPEENNIPLKKSNIKVAKSHNSKNQKSLFTKNFTSMSIYIYVSGSTYPTDNINEPRGKRKSGGIAIYFPQLKSANINLDFESAKKMSFGMPMPDDLISSTMKRSTVLVGFPFLRPSRNRCDLYACHGALKVVSQLLKQLSNQREFRNTDVNVAVYTDSSYVWKLLRNDTLLEAMGASESEKNLMNFGVSNQAMANPDLLFPLTKTMHRIRHKELINTSGKRIVIGDVNISFHHSSDDDGSQTAFKDLKSLSNVASKWQFEKI